MLISKILEIIDHEYMRLSEVLLINFFIVCSSTSFLELMGDELMCV